jgi:hypothetical protein
MSAPDRRALIDRGHGTMSVRRQCALLSLARSGVYSDSGCFHRTRESAHRTDPDVIGQVRARPRRTRSANRSLVCALSADINADMPGLVL